MGAFIFITHEKRRFYQKKETSVYLFVILVYIDGKLNIYLDRINMCRTTWNIRKNKIKQK